MKTLMSVKFIATVVVAMLVVSASVICVDLLSMRAYLEEERRADLELQASGLADAIGKWVAEIKVEGEIYSRVDPIAKGKVDQARSYLSAELAQRQQKDGLVSNMLVVDSQARGHYPDGRVIDLSAHEEIVGSLASQQFQMHKRPVFSPATGNVVLGLSYPLSGPGLPGGIFLYSISLDYLAEVTRTYSTPTRTVFLTTADGTFLAHPERERILKSNTHSTEDNSVQGLDELGRKMDAGETGLGTYRQNGDSMTLAYHPIPGTSWSLGVVENGQALEQVLQETIGSRAFYLGLSALAVLLLVLPVVFRMTKNLRLVRREIKFVAGDDLVKGDLTRRLRTMGNDELGALASFFNSFLGDLQKIVLVVKEQIVALGARGYDLASNMEQTSASVVEINASLTSIENQINRQNDNTVGAQGAIERISAQIEVLEREIGQQGDIVDQGVDSIGEMVKHLDSVTQHVSHLGDFVSKLVEASETGRARLAKTLDAIDDVSERSLSLEETNQVISDIASRTNVLSLNAAIEAAHAGAAGRGFAVVASEIRQLAENSARQSSEVGKSLAEIRQSIDLIVQNAAATEKSFQEITEAIQTVSGTETEVRDSLIEQTEGSRQILKLLEDFRRISKKVRASTSDIGEQNSRVRRQMEELAQSSESVKIGISEITAGTREISSALINVESLTRSNKSAVEAVTRAVGQLRT